MSERERLLRLLEPNGDAGEVEVDATVDPRDGSLIPEPVCQYFAAQAGPYEEGTPVVVLSADEAAEIRTALSALQRDNEPDAWIHPDQLERLRRRGQGSFWLTADVEPDPDDIPVYFGLEQ